MSAELAAIEATAKRRAKVQADLDNLDAELQRHVRAAFDAGHGGTPIARASGLSRARVFQIRDGRR